MVRSVNARSATRWSLGGWGAVDAATLGTRAVATLRAPVGADSARCVSARRAGRRAAFLYLLINVA